MRCPPSARIITRYNIMHYTYFGVPYFTNTGWPEHNVKVPARDRDTGGSYWAYLQ